MHEHDRVQHGVRLNWLVFAFSDSESSEHVVIIGGNLERLPLVSPVAHELGVFGVLPAKKVIIILFNELTKDSLGNDLLKSCRQKCKYYFHNLKIIYYIVTCFFLSPFKQKK